MLQTRKAATQKSMLVIVDLQAELVDMLTYRHGPVSRGIERVEELIGFCRRLEIPIALVTSVNWPDIIPELAEAAAGAPVFRKRKASAFSDNDFSRHVDSISPSNLIVGGSIRHLCAKQTAMDALGRGIGVVSTDEILFGSSDVDSPAAISDAIRFYTLKTRFFPDLYSMESAIRSDYP